MSKGNFIRLFTGGANKSNGSFLRNIKTTYVLAGQSLALGAEDMINLQAPYTGSNSNIQVWNGFAYEDIDSTTNNNQFPVIAQNNKFGTEFSFGKKLSDALSDVVFINKYAIGGSTLEIVVGDDWNTANVGELYDYLKQEITDAGDEDNIKALIWIQGTSDADDAGRSGNYESNLINLINGIRVHVGNPDLKIIIILLNDNLAAAHPYKSQIRTAQCAVREIMSNVVTINPNLISLQIDNVHPNAQGNEDLGNLLYLEETGTIQSQTFTNLLNFDETLNQSMKTAKVIIDTSIITGVRPSYTIHCVYKIDINAATTSSLCGLFDNSTDRALTVFGARTATPGCRLTTYGTGGVDHLTSNANAIVKGRWMSVSFVVNGTASKIYINKVDETALNQIDNTSAYGQGVLGTNWIVGHYDGETPSAVDYFDGKIATWAIIDYAITAGEHDSLTGAIVNGQIQPVKVASVISPTNIASVIEDNYLWDGNNIAGIDSWLSENMTVANIIVDSPS